MNTPHKLESTSDTVTYLEYAVLPPKHFKPTLPLLGNGDYYIYYGCIVKSTDADIKSDTTYSMHVIPEKGKQRLAIRMESLTFYENGKNIGHAAPNGLWQDAGYADDNGLAAKVLSYFNAHKKK